MRVHLGDGSHCPGDGGQRLGRVVRQVDAVLGLGAALSHRLHRRPGARLQPFDHQPDLFGGGVGAGGQGAHLIRHNGEAAPLLPGPGRLDRRIQREQVGLLRHPTDDLQHRADITSLYSAAAVRSTATALFACFFKALAFAKSEDGDENSAETAPAEVPTLLCNYSPPETVIPAKAGIQKSDKCSPLAQGGSSQP